VPDPANLTRSAIDLPDAQIVTATVLDDATTLSDKVRCKLPDDDVGATDPAEWDPIPRPAGLFYPKRGDRAVLAFPEGGDLDPLILRFKPQATEPDHAF